MAKYLLLTKDNMTKDDVHYDYEGLDTALFDEIYYNEGSTQAVVKTKQTDIPESIQQITETEFNQYAVQWPQPTPSVPPEQAQQPGVTLQELNEKVDLLIQMQLERDGIL